MERTPLKTIQLNLKFSDKHGSIVSHFLIGQLNHTLLDEKRTVSLFNYNTTLSKVKTSIYLEKL